jgi:hypothetical protein
LNISTTNKEQNRPYISSSVWDIKEVSRNIDSSEIKRGRVGEKFVEKNVLHEVGI